ncbi:hypothetical protein ACRYCC_13310 [Actinomadura scrupuli]|uniref:hypothetical protein n=1 Tax=Actinomadura scrupuli TaxID=559629 RepID=UPI003D97A597
MDEGTKRRWLAKELVLELAPGKPVAFHYLDMTVGHVLEVWELSHLCKAVLTRASALIRPVLAGGLPAKVLMFPTSSGGVCVQVLDLHITDVPAGAEDGYMPMPGGPGVVRWFVVEPPASQGDTTAPPEGRHHVS